MADYIRGTLVQMVSLVLLSVVGIISGIVTLLLTGSKTAGLVVAIIATITFGIIAAMVVKKKFPSLWEDYFATRKP